MLKAKRAKLGLLFILILLAVLTPTSLIGNTASPPTIAGLNDPLDNFTQIAGKTNIYIEKATPAYFGDDASRMARATTKPGNIIYRTDYDMTSFLVESYFFTGVAIDHHRFYTSKDGIDYTEIAVVSYPVGQTTANWQKYAYEAASLPAGTRYLKIELHGPAKSWSPQISNVILNRSTASVEVVTARLGDSVRMELVSNSSYALIYYRLNDSSIFRLYTQPIQLTGYNTIEAFALEEGLEPSSIRKYALNASAQYEVDRFGQIASAPFKEKITEMQQLRADAAADAAYYGNLSSPAEWDRYGGLSGSAAKYGLHGTGFFDIQQIGSRLVMTTPEGNLFFSLGVNGLTANETYTMIQGREMLFESIPSYEGEYKWAYKGKDNFSFYLANKYRKTGTIPTTYSIYTEAAERIRKWGFNSAGGFSPDQYSDSGNGLPYVRMLPLDNMAWAKINGMSIFDIFAPNAEAKLDELLAKLLTPDKDDPLLIGYFIGNEFDYHKFYSDVPKLKASSAAIKGRLVQRLKDKYEDIGAFNSSWGTGFASFEDLKEAELSLNTSHAWRDMDAFFEYYLDTFYGTVARIFREYDPNHLLLGDRWLTTPFANEKLRTIMAKVEGRYVDVISINHYSYRLEPALLEDVHMKSGGKPILLSEFGYGTAEQGLKPLIPAAAENQYERGMRYRNYVESAASLNYIVGAHLFNYVDQAGMGRYWEGIWGERYNSGLVNVADRPYKAFLEAIMATNYDIYKIILGERPAFHDDI